MYTKESFDEVVAKFHPTTKGDFKGNIVPLLPKVLETLTPEDEILAGSL